MSQSISRRSFLKCAGSGAVSLAAALLTGVCAAAQQPCLAGEPALLDGKAAVELLGYAPAPELGGVLGFFFIREPDLPRGQGTTFSNILYGFRPAVVRDNPRLYLSLAALGVYCMSQQVYMPYLIIYIQRFLGIADYTFLLAGVLIVSSVLSVLAGRPIDRLGKLRCLIPAGIVGFAGLVLMYFARSQWFVLAAGIVMLGGGMVISACCNGLIRDYTPAGKAGLFQGIRIVFQVLLPMVTGPYIGAAVIRGTGMTYEDLGTVKQVPTAEIFLAAAAALVLLAIPAALLKRKEAAK